MAKPKRTDQKLIADLWNAVIKDRDGATGPEKAWAQAEMRSRNRFARAVREVMSLYSVQPIHTHKIPVFRISTLEKAAGSM